MVEEEEEEEEFEKWRKTGEAREDKGALQKIGLKDILETNHDDEDEVKPWFHKKLPASSLSYPSPPPGQLRRPGEPSNMDRKGKWNDGVTTKLTRRVKDEKREMRGNETMNKWQEMREDRKTHSQGLSDFPDKDRRKEDREPQNMDLKLADILEEGLGKPRKRVNVNTKSKRTLSSLLTDFKVKK